MKIFFTFLIFTILLISCKKESYQKLEKGSYRAVLEVQDNQELPFIFEVTNENEINIFNADETIKVDEITYKNDSIIIKTPVYEGYIIAKITKEGLKGSFIKESVDRIVPFSATKSNNRFSVKENATENVSGNWETVFSQNSEEERYIAKGIFNQNNNKVTGTFRTTTGDYRYLEGVVDGDSLKLSTFDGAHAFLFSAKITNSIINGFFYSGNHWKEPFVAKLNNTYELPNEENLTYLKEDFSKFDFSFPDQTGNIISFSDKRFQNKVVLVQIMGTWCPNCLDESKYYVNYLQENPNKDIEIVALAFEIAKTKEIAFSRIKRLKDRIEIKYSVLLADFGNIADKKIAQKKLPMLNHILSYPTTIFIDKKGTVRKIHTGFNGPATGKKFIEFKQEFERFLNMLSNEKE
ncbi:MAG: TlpA disulfide reductase family protein [Polaribacter sp.]|uniref:TlpA disulfide reductase family protein n=1 Tax=Polaribacter sp. TaxID=1920175 RepID=UPI002F3559E5